MGQELYRAVLKLVRVDLVFLLLVCSAKLWKQPPSEPRLEGGHSTRVRCRREDKTQTKPAAFSQLRRQVEWDSSPASLQFTANAKGQQSAFGSLSLFLLQIFQKRSGTDSLGASGAICLGLLLRARRWTPWSRLLEALSNDVGKLAGPYFRTHYSTFKKLHCQSLQQCHY